MQLNYNNRNNSQSRIGTVLNNQRYGVNVSSKNTLLRDQVEELVDILNKKLITNSELLEADVVNYNNNDWTDYDYSAFTKQLSSMIVPLFQMIYPSLLHYLQFSKNELEKELRELDKLLELHVFDDERICNYDYEIVKTEKGDDRRIKVPKYAFVPHVFNTADLLRFFQSLNSKVSSFDSIILKKYDFSVDSELLDEQINEIKLLISLLESEDVGMISLIENSYIEWINNLPSQHIIHSYLKDMLPSIIESNKISLKCKLTDLEKLKYSNDKFSRINGKISAKIKR